MSLGEADAVDAALARLAGELGSQDAAAEIVQLWRAQLPEQLAALRAAAAAGDPSGLHDGAHRLKSTLALLGASELAALALRVEHPETEGADQAAALALALADGCEALAARLAAWPGQA